MEGGVNERDAGMIAQMRLRKVACFGFFAALSAFAEPGGAPAPRDASAAEVLVLPGAANTIGTRGTRWRSDLTLRNPGGDPVEVRVFFLKAGTTNELGGVPHRDFFLVAGETKEIRNVLATELGVSGNGALLVSSSRSLFPNNSPGATVAAAMRTATPLLLGPGDSGGNIFPPDVTNAASAAIGGLRHDGVEEKGVRGAVGAVNLSKNGLTLKVEFLDDAGETVTQDLHVPPLSTAQQMVPARMSRGRARFVRVDGPGPFVAYGTTVDNATSEATFTYAAPDGAASAVRLSLAALE